MMELIITLATGVIAAGWFWALKSRRAENPIKLPSDPFPEEWRGILNSAWPIYRKLPDDLRGQLEQAVSSERLRELLAAEDPDADEPAAEGVES